MSSPLDTKASPSKIYYSASQRGFFHERIHGKRIPADAAEISEKEYHALLEQQTQGLEIHADSSGKPVAQQVSVDERARRLRARRDCELADTDGLVARHRDEVEADVPHTLSADQYRALQAWRVYLRGLPSVPGFPDIEMGPRPVGIA